MGFPGQVGVLEDFNFTRKALLSYPVLGEGIVP